VRWQKVAIRRQQAGKKARCARGRWRTGHASSARHVNKVRRNGSPQCRPIEWPGGNVWCLFVRHKWIALYASGKGSAWGKVCNVSAQPAGSGEGATAVVRQPGCPPREYSAKRRMVGRAGVASVRMSRHAWCSVRRAGNASGQSVIGVGDREVKNVSAVARQAGEPEPNGSSVRGPRPGCGVGKGVWQEKGGMEVCRRCRVLNGGVVLPERARS